MSSTFSFNPHESESEIAFLKRLFDFAKTQDENCIPAIVEEVDKESGDVTVKPLVNRAMYSEDKIVYEDRPSLKVPVAQMRHGGFFISFPVSVGDTGWLFAGDRDWYTAREKNSAKDAADNEGAQNPDSLGKRQFIYGFFMPESWASPESADDRLTIGTTGKAKAYISVLNDGTVQIVSGEKTATFDGYGMTIDGRVQSTDGERKATMDAADLKESNAKFREIFVVTGKDERKSTEGHAVLNMRKMRVLSDEGCDCGDTVDVVAKDGKDGVSVTNATAGAPVSSDGITTTPVTFTFSNGTTRTVNVVAHNGEDGDDGDDGLYVISATAGTSYDQNGYTVTPVTFTLSDNVTTVGPVSILAKNGTDATAPVQSVNGSKVRVNDSSANATDLAADPSTGAVVLKVNKAKVVVTDAEQEITAAKTMDVNRPINFESGFNGNYVTLRGAGSASSGAAFIITTQNTFDGQHRILTANIDSTTQVPTSIFLGTTTADVVRLGVTPTGNEGLAVATVTYVKGLAVASATAGPPVVTTETTTTPVTLKNANGDTIGTINIVAQNGSGATAPVQSVNGTTTRKSEASGNDIIADPTTGPVVLYVNKAKVDLLDEAQTITGAKTFTGAVTVGQNNYAKYGWGYIELYNATPYIEFHFDKSSGYTSRIEEYASGKLKALASEVSVEKNGNKAALISSHDLDEDVTQVPALMIMKDTKHYGGGGVKLSYFIESVDYGSHPSITGRATQQIYTDGGTSETSDFWVYGVHKDTQDGMWHLEFGEYDCLIKLMGKVVRTEHPSSVSGTNDMQVPTCGWVLTQIPTVPSGTITYVDDIKYNRDGSSYKLEQHKTTLNIATGATTDAGWSEICSTTPLSSAT